MTRKGWNDDKPQEGVMLGSKSEKYIEGKKN